jgi:type IV pilus assembly protein PilY1
MNKPNYISILFALPIAAMLPVSALAQVVVSDTLTGATSTYPWTALTGACLTAGTSTTKTGVGGNSYIPACSTLGYYSGKTQVGGVTGRIAPSPDPIGQGALRLTNGDTTTGSNGNSQTGAVISTTPFPTNQGVQVTFSTATYGGNAYGNAAGIPSGADGLAFFLLDGTQTPSIGSYGGSLGYSCSQNKSPGAGVNGGYLAVAIDEYGNFSNPGDATADGPGPTPGAIVVRGAGSITYAALNALNSTYYPAGAADKITPVQNTCKTGFLQNWSGGKITDKNGVRNIANQTSTTETVLDYKLLTPPQILAGTIYNQEATNTPLRSKANVITYDLKVTQDNLLSLSYSYNGGATIPVISKQSITAGNGPLPPSFLFGFTSGTGGGSNVHEITCFKAAPINTAANSAGSNVQQTARVQAGSQVYLSYFHPLNSWGQLLASNLVADTLGNVTIASTANWDASCVLTGGACSATGVATTAQSSSARTILSWNGTQGIPFQYSSLLAADQAAIGGGVDGDNRVKFLRGERSNELTTTGSGVFRKRDGVLGDIINSSPTWVGSPSLPYSTTGKDMVTGTTIAEFGSAYASFASTYKTRANIVYTGSNDGMLHGFRSGAFDSSGSFSTSSTPNDGKEVLAYVPEAVAATIHPASPTLDFSSPQYAHNSYVDATPGTGDLYYNNAWHTWLVGGLGAGGNASGAINNSTSTATGALFALDITNPAGFSESSAASLVIKEWNSNNLTCVSPALCKTSLGSVYGTPIIRRMHDGNWAAIFGNGRNSATGAAGIYIMSVNRGTGATSFRFLDTGSSNLVNKNGIDFVTSVDLDGDSVSDYLYAGDSAGHVWRFDVTSASPANWAADAAPIFTTPAGQPISTRVTVSSVLQKTGAPRVIIGFGTGRQTPQTLSAATGYASGSQSLYGIWDSNMAAWNAMSTTQYASLAGAQTFTTADLQTQTITSYAASSGDIAGFRTVSQTKVCWKGSTNCTSGNNKYGWQVVLPGSSEQIIYSPIVAYGNLIVNTSIPSVTQTLSCTSQPASGYTMSISLDTGGASNSSPFASRAKAAGLTATGVIAGLGLSGTGTPSLVTAGTGTGNSTKTFLVQQTVSGVGNVGQYDPTGTGIGKRLTWVKLR